MAATVIGILSNKGGVGKTHLATNLALALAQKGKKVLVVDADWSSANVTRKLGLTPPRTLRQYFNQECQVADLISATPHHPGLYILAGSPGEFMIANMDPAHKARLLNAFREIAEHSRGDYILIDLGAGVESRTLDTALAADYPLVITTPHDVISGYACLKALLYRFLDLVPHRPAWFQAETFAPMLIVNQVLEPGQGRVVANTMRNFLREYAQERAAKEPAITEFFQRWPSSGSPVQGQARLIGREGGTALLTVAEELGYEIPASSVEVACDLKLLGEVPYARDAFIRTEMNRTPFLLANPNHPASHAIRNIADNLTGDSSTPVHLRPAGNFWQRLTELVTT